MGGPPKTSSYEVVKKAALPAPLGYTGGFLVAPAENAVGPPLECEREL